MALRFEQGKKRTRLVIIGAIICNKALRIDTGNDYTGSFSLKKKNENLRLSLNDLCPDRRDKLMSS